MIVLDYKITTKHLSNKFTLIQYCEHNFIGIIVLLQFFTITSHNILHNNVLLDINYQYLNTTPNYHKPYHVTWWHKIYG